jgi:hypothetical protein
MGEERLSGLATLSIHSKISMDLDLDTDPDPDPDRGGGVWLGQPKMCIPPGKILGTPLAVSNKITSTCGTDPHFTSVET